jgi:hypothetical protein
MPRISLSAKRLLTGPCSYSFEPYNIESVCPYRTNGTALYLLLHLLAPAVTLQEKLQVSVYLTLITQEYQK